MSAVWLYLLEVLAFPLALAAGLTLVTTREVDRYYRNRNTTSLLVSEEENEQLDPSMHGLTKWLLFALFFNIVYLTVNISLVQATLFDSVYLYVASVGAFLVASFLALVYAFRFHEKRFLITGIAFSILGTVVIFSSIQLGFGHWTAYGTSASSATSIGAKAPDYIVPIVMAGVVWAITLVSFLLDLRVGERFLPFRIEQPEGYRVMLAALALGWTAMLIAMIHPILSLL